MIDCIYLIGLGAIGSLYGSKIHEAFPDNFKVLADSKRMDRYITTGVIINDDICQFHYQDIAKDAAPADLLIFAVKQYQLEAAMASVEKFATEKTIILSLLNGIGSESMLEKKFKKNKIVYSLCIGQDAVRNGAKTSYTKPGKIVFGNYDGNNATPEIKQIKNIFDMSGINNEVSDKIIHEQWKKFLINVSINQFSAILDAPYGVFQNSSNAKELLKMAALEVIELSKKLDIDLNGEFIDEFISVIGTLSPKGLTSMLQDTRAGRKTEYEMLSGTVIKLADELGINVPVNKVLYHLMSTKEFMRTGQVKKYEGKKF